MIRKCYPFGKKKAFNVTYDDGVLQDVRFVELMNQYGLKGTFNLNSALMENEFEWVHETGCVVKRLKTDVVKSLYVGHEVASHTLNHPYMHDLSKEGIMWELSQDKRNLEAKFGKEIKGFVVPFDYYSELIEECVKECGFTYGRVSEMSYSFRSQNDFYRWKAMEKAEITDQYIQNHSDISLWFIINDIIYEIKPREKNIYNEIY